MDPSERMHRALHHAWIGGRTRWPDVALDLDDFVAHVGPLLRDDRDLESLLGDDLFLACACARGQQAAIACFEREVLTDVDRAVRGLDAADAFLDEVKQRLRTKLLTGDAEHPPRIAEYAGRGALVAWVTVAAIRTGLSFLRETKRASKYEGDGWAEALALPDVGDVEVDLVKRRYREPFVRGLTLACQALPARERTILRMHFVDGLNIDQIGVVYGVHRATVARWIAKCRTALLEGTRRYLADQLAVPTAELSSLDRLVRSQVDVSLGALFPADVAADVVGDDP